MEKIKNHKELKIWNQGIDVVCKIYALTNSFPKSEMYGLAIQMRRSAISIPSNIAEGFKRPGSKEFIRFLRISQASAAELETQLIISKRLSYFDEQEGNELEEEINCISKMISNLIKKINVRYQY